MLQCLYTMDTTLKRFESGVHDKGECGLNKSGYAAIDSAVDYTDVHRLNSCMISSSSRPLMHSRKRSFLSSEGLVYIFMKLMKIMPGICTYVLLLTRDMPVSQTFKSIIEASAAKGNIIISVIELGGKFSIDLYFMHIHLSHQLDSFVSLKSFIVQSGWGSKIVVIGYPALPDQYMEIANSIDTVAWCAPASRHLTYSSQDQSMPVEHFVYPWSKSPLCSGFTLGKGKIKYSPEIDRHKYVGLYNTYEMMISSVPYGDSCIDCVELQSTASNIKCLTESDNKPERPRNLKRSSMDALEELKLKISEYTSQC
jgi:hypothetical protein